MEIEDYTKDMILGMFNSGNPDAICNALIICELQETTDPDIDAYFLHYLSDSSPEVRRMAACAVGQRGLIEGVAELAKGLRDEDWRVRLLYGYSLRKLLENVPNDYLFGAVDNGVPWVAYLSCVVLSARGYGQAPLIHKLRELSKHEDIRAAIRVPSIELEPEWKKIIGNNELSGG